MITAAKESYIAVYYGNTHVSAGTMVVDGSNDHIWYFYGTEATPIRHYPISSKNLILLGTKSGVSRFLVNYTLEPLTGKITIPASFPVFDSITAWFYYYTIATPIPVLTQNFLVEIPDPSYQPSIWDEPSYVLHNVVPTAVNFNMVLSDESQRNLLTESIMHGYFFLIVDKYIPDTYGIKAYEGPIISKEQMSLYKGLSYLLPIKMSVCQVGSYDHTSATINWEAFKN